MFREEQNNGIFQPLIGSWYESLENPEEAQSRTLSNLSKMYGNTQYGKDHNSSQIKEITEFRLNFPIMNYDRLNPYLSDVIKGHYDRFLPEPPVCWVMTRGSTGPAKVLPATGTHIEQILTCGSRALINHALRKKDYEILDGKILNLNFPANVHTMIMDGHEVPYGYSSGTYAKLIPALDRISLVPRQEEIDALGSGIGRRDWERRFELAYQKALNENVTATMGVTPVILSFARYLSKKHGKKPKELWKLRALFCTSVRKIQFKYGPPLRRLFGEIPVVEIYSATEGVFGQQLDDLPYVSPNYDAYLFEVKTDREIKMLHELKRGEWGRLIVSTCMLPRYAIGDLIESAGGNYFRVIGRDKWSTLIEHRLYRSLFGWFV